jgi:hypothetical protein
MTCGRTDATTTTNSIGRAFAVAMICCGDKTCQRSASDELSAPLARRQALWILLASSPFTMSYCGDETSGATSRRWVLQCVDKSSGAAMSSLFDATNVTHSKRCSLRASSCKATCRLLPSVTAIWHDDERAPLLWRGAAAVMELFYRCDERRALCSLAATNFLARRQAMWLSWRAARSYGR